VFGVALLLLAALCARPAGAAVVTLTDAEFADASWIATALAALDALVCETSATQPSAVCRIQDLLDLAEEHVADEKLRRSLVKLLGKAEQRAAAAADLGERPARAAFKHAAKLVGKVRKRLRSKRAQREIEAVLRTQLLTPVDPLRSDLKTLARGGGSSR
jgi:hypothetical protein